MRRQRSFAPFRCCLHTRPCGSVAGSYSYRPDLNLPVGGAGLQWCLKRHLVQTLNTPLDRWLQGLNRSFLPHRNPLGFIHPLKTPHLQVSKYEIFRPVRLPIVRWGLFSKGRNKIFHHDMERPLSWITASEEAGTSTGSNRDSLPGLSRSLFQAHAAVPVK